LICGYYYPLRTSVAFAPPLLHRYPGSASQQNLRAFCFAFRSARASARISNVSARWTCALHAARTVRFGRFKTRFARILHALCCVLVCVFTLLPFFGFWSFWHTARCRVLHVCRLRCTIVFLRSCTPLDGLVADHAVSRSPRVLRSRFSSLRALSYLHTRDALSVAAAFVQRRFCRYVRFSLLRRSGCWLFAFTVAHYVCAFSPDSALRSVLLRLRLRFGFRFAFRSLRFVHCSSSRFGWLPTTTGRRAHWRFGIVHAVHYGFTFANVQLLFAFSPVTLLILVRA